MKHGEPFRRLGRNPKHLKAMLRNLATSLFDHEVIKTTVPRAKELKRYAEKVLTNAKKGNETEVRRVIFQERVVQKLLYDIAPRYAERQGGYTRVLKVGPRQGDKAEMAMIELVDRPGEIRPKPKEATVIEKMTKLKPASGKIDLLPIATKPSYSESN